MDSDDRGTTVLFMYEGVNCGPAPATPTNGQRYVSGTLYQDIVRYSCHADYVIEGPEELRCEANGQWSGDAPVCKSKGEKA